MLFAPLNWEPSAADGQSLYQFTPKQISLLSCLPHQCACLSSALSEYKRSCRPLWDLHRCLLALEYATFACPANEEELVHMRLSHCAPASSKPAQERGSLARE